MLRACKSNTRLSIFSAITLMVALLSQSATTAYATADQAPANTEQAAPAKQNEQPEVVSQAKIDQLIRDLDADSFTTREAASEQLTKMGAPAAVALEKAATSDSPEQADRALRVLQSFAGSTNQTDKEAGTKALEKLSQSDNKSVASAAAKSLKAATKKTTAPKNNPNVIQIPNGQGGVIKLRIGGIQINGAGGAKFQQIKKTNINGVETTEVTETDGSRIKIEKNKTIKVTVTKKVKGKDQTKTYEADDVEALKKKHPDAHKLYKKYGEGNAAAIQLKAFRAIPGFPIPRNRIQPAKPAPKNKAGNADSAEKDAEISKAQAKLADAIKKLTPNKGDAGQPDIDAARKQLQEAVKLLEQAKNQK